MNTSFTRITPMIIGIVFVVAATDQDGWGGLALMIVAAALISIAMRDQP